MWKDTLLETYLLTDVEKFGSLERGAKACGIFDDYPGAFGRRQLISNQPITNQLTSYLCANGHV